MSDSLLIPRLSSEQILTSSNGRFASYTEGMTEVENAKVKTKAEADTILKKYEPVRFLSPKFDLLKVIAPA